MNSTSPGGGGSEVSVNLTAAVGYADAGYPVLILYPIREGQCACPDRYKLAGKCKPGKHPIGELCPRAHQSATTDKVTLTTWWSLWPDGGIGIALGPAGLVDVAPDSTEWWTRFVGLGLPKTMHFRSGGGEGHEHWLYKRGDMPAVRNAQRGRYDVLSDGYCVAPPTMHESGRCYEWIDRVLPVDAPEWVDEFQTAYLTERASVNDEPLEAWDDDLPFDLDDAQQRVWLGVGAAADRSQGLIDIGRMLWDAGLHDLEAVASILKERDEGLGWNKYSTRRNAAFRYREAAQRGVPPIRVKLFRNSAYRGGNTGTASAQIPTPSGGSGLQWHSVPDVMAMAAEQVEWLIQDWLSKGLMTELVAKVKMGKTTFALEGLRAAIAGDESYCGKAIMRPIRVGYVTEEGVGTFQQNLVRYGLSDLGESDGFYTVFDFETPIGVDLPQIVNDLIQQGQERGVDVIVLDTLSVVAGLDEEDHSGKAAGVMHEIRRLANAGFAVLILRHSRKSGGDVGDAGRGSSAISGYCDILLQIEPFKGDEDTTNLRILRCRSRMSASIEPLTLELDKQTERYKLIGTVQSKEERLQGVILAALRDLGATSETKGVTSAEVTVKSGKQKAAVTDQLKAMVSSGEVKSAKHAQSIVYWLPLQVHITHEPEPVPPVPPVPGTAGTPEQVAEPSPPKGGLEETEPVPVAVPEKSPSSLEEGTAGTAKPAKREKTPEAVAKLAEAKAARELARLEAADLAAPTLAYHVVSDSGDLWDAVKALSLEAVALDTETTGLDAHRDKLRTINLSDGETHVVIDVFAMLEQPDTDWIELQSYLDGVGQVRMHTYLFDLAFLAQVGLRIDPAKISDVKTMSMVLESQEAPLNYRLQDIAKRHLHEHVEKREQKGGWDAPAGGLRHAKLAYAAEDARVTFDAGHALQNLIETDLDNDSLLGCLNLERDVQAATWWMASAGVPADAALLRRAIAEQEALIDDRLQELNGIAGVAPSVNWRSPSQVLPILQERGLEVFSTGVDALMEAQSDDPIIDALLAYRSAGTCMGLLRKTLSAVQDDGRIYASFNPIGAQTGRTSCSEPNLQQLPHETLARASIRPGPGRVFVRADYSQLQLVIAAWISNDVTMRQILNTPGGDIHQATADAAGCTRSQAKAINFGFLFGAGADTFRREQRKNGVVMTEQQAINYRRTFFRTYPGIRAWHRGLGEWGVESEVIDFSGSGRRRKAIYSNNVKANTPVQMVEAHGFKLAMRDLYETRDLVPSARLVMMVHDELIAECDAADSLRCQQWLKSNMEAAMQPLVPGIHVQVDPLKVEDYSDAAKKRAEKAAKDA